MKSSERASSANNNATTVFAITKDTARTCGITAYIVLLLIILVPAAMASSEPMSEPHPLKSVSEKPLSSSKTVRHVSWGACLEAAERARSNRDFEFFKSSKNLSDAKGWLVSHSLNNERLFCDDIALCQTNFSQLYSQGSGSYPACY